MNVTAPTNWGSSSGTADNASVPGASDDATFDGAGANGNTTATNNSNLSLRSLTFTSGYTSTVTMNTGLGITTGVGGFTDNTAHSWTVNGTASLIIGGTSTVTSGGKTFPGNVQLSGGTTVTLGGGDWTITGNVQVNSSTVTVNSNNLNINGVFTATNGIQGTAVIVMKGGSIATSANIKNSLTFDGNVTLGAALTYNTGTMTYTSGTITTTGNTITCAASTTWNTNGITFVNINFSGTGTTQTINSLLSCSGTLTLPSTGAITFAGTTGFTTATLDCGGTANTVTVTLANTVTYTITASFTAFSSRVGSIILFTSDHATNKAILTLNAGATCSVLANATRIDSSAGRTINTFHGTLTSTTNWFSYTDYGGGIASSYVWA